MCDKKKLTTAFVTIPIPATASRQGIPLGRGGCVGVRLYLNSLVMNTQTNTATNVNQAQIYFGDSRQQSRELLRGQETRIIHCTDLSQIWVRCNGVATSVEIEIFSESE